MEDNKEPNRIFKRTEKHNNNNNKKKLNRWAQNQNGGDRGKNQLT